MTERQPRKIPLDPVKATQEFVKIYQSILGAEEDGKVTTDLLVKTWAYQRTNKINKDGVFGPASARAFLNKHAPFDKNPEALDPRAVKLIQWVLGEKVDGKWTEDNENALRETQKTVGVKVTGIIDPETLDRILTA